MADFACHSGCAPPNFPVLDKTSAYARAQRHDEHAPIACARACEILAQRGGIRIVHHMNRGRREHLLQER